MAETTTAAPDDRSATPPLPLPPAAMRWGGPRYRDDAVFLSSAAGGARLLERECGVSAASRVLDIGCGQGRLLHGLLAHFGAIGRYVGLDVHAPSIRWLKENVEPVAPYARFHRVAVRNERYNPQGAGSLDLELDERFDCVTLLSVFSHMRLDDIAGYLAFIERHLDADGRVQLTAFVEDGVEPETENPANYYRDWTGPLHCVRLNRQGFEALAWRSGLQVARFRYRTTNDGQSSYVFMRRDRPFAATVVR
jgi:SAM-dependent methyltransferase